MPVGNYDVSNLLLEGLRTVFGEAYMQESDLAIYDKIATVIPSNKDSESYGWLGNVPSMREWKDERMPKGLLQHDYSLKNLDYEASISVDRNTLMDDLYGQIALRVRGLASEAARHSDQLVVAALAGGFTGYCYDGQYFFDTDHAEGASGTQSNRGTSALAAASLQAAIIAMMKFKDDTGKPMGIIPDTLVVPPDLQWTAMELLESVDRPDTANRAKNVLNGKLDLLVSPYLTDTDNWYVLCTKRIVKPIILQQRKQPEFNALEGNSERGFMRKEYVYGVDERKAVGYGLWQCAYGNIV